MQTLINLKPPRHRSPERHVSLWQVGPLESL